MFIANEVNVSSLERRTWSSPAGDTDKVRVPAADIIDLSSLERADVFFDQMYERCDGIVHENFDQLGGGFLPRVSDLSLSAQRIRLPGSEGAAGRLQDTNVSAVDLTKAPFTSGTGR
ncbi:MAG: hypothetical protein J4G03_07590 [Gemmatimonadetes bacterium]|nr:hypothetical protein [Gemmatimonadota bacterium]